MKRTKAPAMAYAIDSAVVQQADVDVTSFKLVGDEGVTFRAGEDNSVDILVLTKEVEPFHGPLFTSEFNDYLTAMGVGGYTFDKLYEVVMDELRRAVAMEAIMRCLK